MKRLFLLFVIVSIFSCAKEKLAPSISGTWTIVETSAGTGTGLAVQTYAPSSEITIEFGANGNLVLTGSNPGTAASPLWEFDRYQLLPDNKIRFFQSAGPGEIEASFTLNGQLHLNYQFARCGYEEKFVRLK